MFEVIIIVVFLAVLFYVAMIYTSEALLLLAFSSAIFVVLSFVFLSVQRWLLRGKLEIPIDTADAGSPVTVRVLLDNRGFLACFRVKLAIEVKNAFGRGKKRVWLKASRVLPGENAADYSAVFGEAGCYEVSLRKCRIYDMAGILSVSKRMKGRRNILVLPQVREVGIVLREPVRNFFGDADVYDEERGGHDNSEIFQIRPFMAGDKLQSIHWKLSAKADDLMVKESSLPKACPVVLLLGFTARGRDRGTAGSFLDIAASLSFSLMDAGCPHYAAWYDGKTKDLTRLRVDDEESFYLFLSYYLKEQGGQPPEDLPDCYGTRYRAEHYLYSLYLTEELALYKNHELICQFTDGKYWQQLGGLEIVL